MKDNCDGGEVLWKGGNTVLYTPEHVHWVAIFRRQCNLQWALRGATGLDISVHTREWGRSAADVQSYCLLVASLCTPMQLYRG